MIATRIGELFATRIEEKIEPVIKVGETSDEKKLAAEIGSYVVTPMIEKYLDDLLEHYTDTFLSQTTEIGTWISGYFGSGKSHLAKTVALLANNRPLAGPSACERFAARIPADAPRATSIKRSLSRMGQCATSILAFNLNTLTDSKHRALPSLLLSQYYQSLGYGGNLLYARVIEAGLDRQGKLDELHAAVERRAKKKWSEIQRNLSFYRSHLYAAACEVAPDIFPSEDAVNRAMQEAERGELHNVAFLVDTLLDDLHRKEQAEKKRQRLLLVLDEAGQWIGDDGDRLAQLQALVEESAIKGQGRIFLIVTTHGDMGSIYKEARAVEEDMKKIEGRFRFKFALTTENIELVLEDRLFRKKMGSDKLLLDLYDKRSGELRGLGELADTNQALPPCTAQKFAIYYPFLPYQIHLIPEIVKSLRSKGGRGEQLSGSTRTLLAITQDILRAGRRHYLDEGIGALVSFDEVYENLQGEGEISPDVRTELSRIKDVVPGATPLTAHVAEVLFLIREIPYIPRTRDNIARLLIEHTDDNLPLILGRIQPELNRLIAAKLVARIGDDPPNNVAMLVLAAKEPAAQHRMSCFRISASRPAEEQAEILRRAIREDLPGIRFLPAQCRFLTLPQSPLCYWLRERFFELLAVNTLGSVAYVCQGMATANNERFTRCYWENSVGVRWIPYAKGGGYAKWAGLDWLDVDWEGKGLRIGQTPGPRIQNQQFFGDSGLTYSPAARGGVGVRLFDNGAFDVKGASLFMRDKFPSRQMIAVILNSRMITYIVRAISQSRETHVGYLALVPVSTDGTYDDYLFSDIVFSNKNLLICKRITERNFTLSNIHQIKAERILLGFHVEVWLSIVEDYLEKAVFQRFSLSDADISAIFSDTGTPAGWHPKISGYDAIPPRLGEVSEQDEAMIVRFLASGPTTSSIAKMLATKERLRSLYEAGPGGQIGEEENAADDDEGEEECLGGALIPIPAETFLEELSQKLEIHPISVYWLLKEGIEKEGWRCIPEERRFVTEQFTVTILRLLGHRWPRQVEAGEAVPDWADQDGIIPITAGTQETTLYDRVHARIAADFPGGDVASIEREFAEIMGKPLDRWIETEFFKHHTQQFKKRPIAWQIQSSKFTAKRKPAFACLLYYHKLDGDTLPKLRSQYVGPLRQRLETELRGIEAVPKEGRSDRQQSRQRELADQLIELRDFDKKLEQVQTNGFAFTKLAEQLRAESIDDQCSPDGIRPPPSDQADFLRQEQSYLPDINDGVRVNIAPLQQAGLLAADVIAGKDLDKAITDRATWRSDERRWSRAGKLPQPGYFRVKPQPGEEGAAA